MINPIDPNTWPDTNHDNGHERCAEDSARQEPEKSSPFNIVMRDVTSLGAPAALDATLSDAGSRGQPVGEILAAAGKLSGQDLQRVIAHQTARRLHFGEAAVKLGLIAESDLHQALARQYGYPCVVAGASPLSRDIVAAYEPLSERAEALRTLREELIARWIKRVDGGNAIAVVSPGRAEGRSYLTANLAVLFAQLGMRALLIDADMRRPRQHALFGLNARNGLSAVLSGRGDPTSVRKVAPFEGLSLLPAGVPPPNPHELLAGEEFRALIHRAERQVDVVLVDTPAGAHSAEALSAAVNSRAALLVARRDNTRAEDLATLENRLCTAGVSIVGTVLNEGPGTSAARSALRLQRRFGNPLQGWQSSWARLLAGLRSSRPLIALSQLHKQSQEE